MGLLHPFPSWHISGEIPGALLDLGGAGGNQTLAGGEVQGSGQCCPGDLMCQPVFLIAPEPTVEEKLQKLHSEIKFALKVDNPVSSESLGLAWEVPLSSATM